MLFADHQYDALPYQPWQPETELEWVPADSLVTGEEVWIPLLATHLGYRPPTEAALFPATSNGFAAWPDRAGATLRALLEVIERDAFAIAWSHRLPGHCVAAADVPDEQTRAIASAYARRGVEVVVHLLPTDTVATVALAIMWSAQAPNAVIGVGAALDPIVAARSAVFEAGQVRPILRTRLRDPAVRARMAELAAEPSKLRPSTTTISCTPIRARPRPGCDSSVRHHLSRGRTPYRSLPRAMMIWSARSPRPRRTCSPWTSRRRTWRVSGSALCAPWCQASSRSGSARTTPGSAVAGYWNCRASWVCDRGPRGWMS